MAGTDHLFRSQQEAISIVDDAYKRNKVNPFLNRAKDDITGLKEAMLDKVSPSIIETDFHDVIKMIKSCNKAVGAVIDIPEDPAWEHGLKNFVAAP